MTNRQCNAEHAVLALAREQPELGNVRAARELHNQGIRLSPSGVREIWKRHGLGTGYLRLVAVKRDSGGESAPLSDAQRALLVRMRMGRRAVAQGGSNPDSTGQLRREQLIKAAAHVFSAKGYEGASLREICAAAGILPGSLYFHFRSKEDLYVTVHAEGFRQINEAVDRALARETDPWRRLEAVCAAHLTQLIKHGDVRMVTATSLFQTANPALQRRLRRERDAFENRYRELIAALALPPDVDQTLLRLTLLGALNWTRIWYRPGKTGPAEIAHHLVNKILRENLDVAGRQVSAIPYSNTKKQRPASLA